MQVSTLKLTQVHHGAELVRTCVSVTLYTHYNKNQDLTAGDMGSQPQEKFTFSASVLVKTTLLIGLYPYINSGDMVGTLFPLKGFSGRDVMSDIVICAATDCCVL